MARTEEATIAPKSQIQIQIVGAAADRRRRTDDAEMEREGNIQVRGRWMEGGGGYSPFTLPKGSRAWCC